MIVLQYWGGEGKKELIPGEGEGFDIYPPEAFLDRTA